MPALVVPIWVSVNVLVPEPFCASRRKEVARPKVVCRVFTPLAETKESPGATVTVITTEVVEPRESRAVMVSI